MITIITTVIHTHTHTHTHFWPHEEAGPRCTSQTGREGGQCSCREKAAVTAEAVEGWNCACVCVCVCVCAHARAYACMPLIYISVVRGRQVYIRTSTFEEGRITSCDSLSSFKKVEAVS